ncbi:MAG: metallophosphoesterase family protein [Promethearchaeota archaeon]|jgi:predicted phosphohydrolase
MKIVFTADTHNCPNLTDSDMLKVLAKGIFAESPDLVILGGDIGETRINISLFTEVLKILGKGVLVLGNHDLWTSPNKPYTSRDLWERILPQICHDQGWHYLEQTNWIKDGIAIVGSYLHYDYSAADPEGAAVDHIRSNFPEWTTDEYYRRMKKRAVNDAKFFKGLPPDKIFARVIGEDFEKRLLDAESDPEVESIVVATHVPCMPSQITRKPSQWHWSCATAYFGNLSHVEAIMSCSKVRYVLSGHSHQENRETVTFHDGHTAEVITLGADYGEPDFEIIEV